MVERLQRLLDKPVITVMSLSLLFFIIVSLFLGAVSVLSDVGFSNEVTTYRWWIVLGAGILGLLTIIFYLYWYLWRGRGQTALQSLKTVSDLT